MLQRRNEEKPCFRRSSIGAVATIELRNFDPEVPDLAEKGARMDSELFRRRLAVAPVPAKRINDVALLQRAQGCTGPARNFDTLAPAGQLGREMLELDESAPTQYETVLDDVLELAGVAREVMAHQQRQGIVRHRSDVLFLQPVEAVDKVVDQEGNVLPPVRTGARSARLPLRYVGSHTRPNVLSQITAFSARV
jgi:hypothetical protein